MVLPGVMFESHNVLWKVTDFGCSVLEIFCKHDIEKDYDHVNW